VRIEKLGGASLEQNAYKSVILSSTCFALSASTVSITARARPLPGSGLPTPVQGEEGW
jgi:hypothetical protein